MQRPTGITLIAIWHFIGTLMGLLGTCAVTIPIIAVWAESGDPDEAFIATIALLFGMVVIFVLSIISAVVGWGLWQLKSWSRAAAIVLAVVQLIGFPIGTIIGGLTIYYLVTDDDAKAAFGVA